ncbi:MAG: CocE/NonD family hydrolase, partial [Myxococcota bacterium]
DGVMTDEYTEQEQLDAVEVIAWIARQPWCTGRVGMMGISWGGFNALQVAARRPPELGAIITLCASDDRYTDDAHYMGGCLLNENLQWGSILMAYNALPPDPDIVGSSWLDLWIKRLDAATPFPALWMQHPTRDTFWKQGSVNEDYGAIQCPVYAIGGWADGYSNAVPRLLEGLEGPKKGLIGPWVHAFPQTAVPGPRIGFLQEALRWWDHWLKDVDTDIMREPLLRIWMQNSVPPAPQYSERPGRWITEERWPSPNVSMRTLYLSPSRLDDSPPEDREVLPLASPQITGMVSGEWCAFGAEGEMPLDQRPDDGRSLVFDGPPLAQNIEILGAPVVELEIESDTEIAMLAVRLNEVDLGGASTRVTYGLLNLTHRSDHEHPLPMPSGNKVPVKIQLNDIAHVFSAGHRIRLAVSTAYWPIAWPPPKPVLVRLHLGRSILKLPVRAAVEDPPVSFPPPEIAHSTIATPLRALPFQRTVERDLTSDEVVYTLQTSEFDGHATGRLPDIDMVLGHQIQKRHRICPTDPLSARSEMTQWASLERGDWRIRIECRTEVRSEPDTLHFTAELIAKEQGEIVRRLVWDEHIPRRGF